MLELEGAASPQIEVSHRPPVWWPARSTRTPPAVARDLGRICSGSRWLQKRKAAPTRSRNSLLPRALLRASRRTSSSVMSSCKTRSPSGMICTSRDDPVNDVRTGAGSATVRLCYARAGAALRQRSRRPSPRTRRPSIGFGNAVGEDAEQAAFRGGVTLSTRKCAPSIRPWHTRCARVTHTLLAAEQQRGLCPAFT